MSTKIIYVFPKKKKMITLTKNTTLVQLSQLTVTKKLEQATIFFFFKLTSSKHKNILTWIIIRTS